MKRNIAIVAGGYSSEYGVSLKSAEGLYSFIDKDKYNLYIAIVKKGEWAVKCSCGETINIQTEKLSSRKCPHCGNDVVFDQSKGDKAKCPVCHEPINTMAEQDKTVEFSCGQCGIRLRAAK